MTRPRVTNNTRTLQHYESTLNCSKRYATHNTTSENTASTKYVTFDWCRYSNQVSPHLISIRTVATVFFKNNLNVIILNKQKLYVYTTVSTTANGPRPFTITTHDQLPRLQTPGALSTSLTRVICNSRRRLNWYKQPFHPLDAEAHPCMHSKH
jgi:hypothetical protein